MSMAGMTHANDVEYDAYLANDRTLSDPEVIAVQPGPMRLRIINGATLAVVGSARKSVAYRNAKFDWDTY
jgi:hypothetical protein